MFCSGISRMKTTTPTAAIVVYWRVRYADAPSWTAAEIERMRSLPGERASSWRAVTKPYAIAQAEHTSATRSPWCVRKLDKYSSGNRFENERDGSAQHRKKAAASMRWPDSDARQ